MLFQESSSTCNYYVAGAYTLTQNWLPESLNSLIKFKWKTHVFSHDTYEKKFPKMSESLKNFKILMMKTCVLILI